MLRLYRRFVASVRQGVDWLDQHNGAVTAAATVIIALLTYSLAKDSAKQAEIANGTLHAVESQLDAMQQDLRPYIKVETSVDGSIEFNDGNMIMPVKYKVSNVGKTPAFDLRIRAYSYTGKSPYNGQLFPNQEKACGGLAKQPFVDQEQIMVIFPNESVPWDKSLGSSIPGLSKKNIADMSTYENGKEVFQFWFFVCADYTFGNKREHHQTGYLFHVTPLIRELATVSRSPTVINGQDVPSNDIMLQAHPSARSVTN